MVKSAHRGQRSRGARDRWHRELVLDLLIHNLLGSDPTLQYPWRRRHLRISGETAGAFGLLTLLQELRELAAQEEPAYLPSPVTPSDNHID